MVFCMWYVYSPSFSVFFFFSFCYFFVCLFAFVVFFSLTNKHLHCILTLLLMLDHPLLVSVTVITFTFTLTHPNSHRLVGGATCKRWGCMNVLGLGRWKTKCSIPQTTTSLCCGTSTTPYSHWIGTKFCCLLPLLRLLLSLLPLLLVHSSLYRQRMRTRRKNRVRNRGTN